jgi:hypothetical protein
MKIPFAVLFLLGFLISHSTFAQDTSVQNNPVTEYDMLDTSIAIDPSFIVRNLYAAKDSVMAYRSWASKMRDTTIDVDPAFVVRNVYAERDSIASLYGGFASRRDSLIHAIRDSLSRIGSALLHTAEMQDTVITLEPAFVVSEIYADKDRLDAAKDSVRAAMILAASMQDTTIAADPSFIVFERYAKKDKYEVFRDSVWAALAEAAQMKDTTLSLDPSFVVRNVYETRDRLEAYQDSLAWPTIMRDTLVALDASFVLRDLYPQKDYRDSVREAETAYADSVYTDSVNRHWAGWKKYEVEPDHPYNLNAGKILKNASKTSLEYNIADFYLYLNGDPVKPDNSNYDFFAASCLAFKYNDTLLLNSGLGFKVGVGVGIKITQGMFTSSLHANKHNEEIYKQSDDDSVYMKSIVVEPSTQSLKLQFEPSYQSKEVITGEYQAAYKKFYQKNEDGQDVALRYTVRIVFRCRVTGGLDTLNSQR